MPSEDSFVPPVYVEEFFERIRTDLVSGGFLGHSGLDHLPPLTRRQRLRYRRRLRIFSAREALALRIAPWLHNGDDY